MSLSRSSLSLLWHRSDFNHHRASLVEPASVRLDYRASPGKGPLVRGVIEAVVADDTLDVQRLRPRSLPGLGHLVGYSAVCPIMELQRNLRMSARVLQPLRPLTHHRHDDDSFVLPDRPHILTARLAALAPPCSQDCETHRRVQNAPHRLHEDVAHACVKPRSSKWVCHQAEYLSLIVAGRIAAIAELPLGPQYMRASSIMLATRQIWCSLSLK